MIVYNLCTPYSTLVLFDENYGFQSVVKIKTNLISKPIGTRLERVVTKWLRWILGRDI